MKVTKTSIKVKDVIAGYHDDGDQGVFTMNDQLIVRPAYQREFVYTEKEEQAVVNSVMHGFPLNVMYYNVRNDGKYEILDGQQRTLSLCKFSKGSFSYGGHFYGNMPSDLKEKFENYNLDIYLCEGTESEKLDWFRVINTAGEALNDQELLNATYSGQWLTDAKQHFSKTNGSAVNLGEGYIKGDPIRQDILKQVLIWACDKDGIKERSEYMARHQGDKDADALWQYYQQILAWARMLFDNTPKRLHNGQPWGLLYNEYHNTTYYSSELNNEVKKLVDDDEVQSTSGIIPYVLSDHSINSQKLLHLRTFTKKQALAAYESQEGICPICKKHYEFSEMEADHIVPWSQGGTTTPDNLQMLCKKDNRKKSDK